MTMITRSIATAKKDNDDGYISYFIIVKFIILLICLQYIFYCRRLLPPEEQTPRGMGRREAGDDSRGRGGFMSGVL